MSAGARGGPANRPAKQRAVQANGRPGPEHRRVGQPGGERRGDGDALAGYGHGPTAGAPVKERGQKGPSVANGAGEGEAESARAMASLNLLPGSGEP